MEGVLVARGGSKGTFKAILEQGAESPSTHIWRAVQRAGDSFRAAFSHRQLG